MVDQPPPDNQGMFVTTPSPDNKAMAKFVAATFGGEPKIMVYDHDTEPLRIPILSCRGPDMSSYSTIGLSDHVMQREDGEPVPFRIELAGVCANQHQEFASALASAAFCITRTGRAYVPGCVLPGYTRLCAPDTTVPHFYLTAPYPWSKELAQVEFDQKTVLWALVVPISDQEYEYLKAHTDDELETLLEAKDVSIWDLYRPSSV